jgi:hypothetical protein
VRWGVVASSSVDEQEEEMGNAKPVKKTILEKWLEHHAMSMRFEVTLMAKRAELARARGRAGDAELCEAMSALHVRAAKIYENALDALRATP